MDSIIMLSIVIWIVVLELGPLNNFVARKLCHAGCGLGIMLLNSRSLPARVFVWLVAGSSIAMTWNLSPLPPFRFSRPRDVGITVYLCLVSAWLFLELPPSVLAPLFFSDPAGAVVGKACSQLLGPSYNPAWYGSKTVAGTAAVFIFTFLSITFDLSTFARLRLSALAAVAEALGGEFDNLAIAAVVLGGWLLS
jgi:dolichol kinase